MLRDLKIEPPYVLQEMVIQLLFELDSVRFQPRDDGAVDLRYQ